MNKTAIRNFAIWARNKLIADVSYRAGLMGITKDGIAEALPQSTSDVEFYDICTAEPYSIHNGEIKQRKSLVELIRQKEKDSDYITAYTSVIEEVAYTWFNRLIAVRFMEVNDYLPAHVRVLSSESGKQEPDIVTTPFDAELFFAEGEKQEIIQMKNDNKLDEVFRKLFIKQCRELSRILPRLFEGTNDYTELLLSVSFIDQEGVVYHLVHDIPEEDFNVEQGGQVEIIGWLYQYYNAELKDETFALLKNNVKVTKERIPSATQLFTPDWIVRYMVENSLGRLWIEGHPNDLLKSRWKYYLDEAEQEDSVKQEMEKIKAEYAKLSPEDIKVIDPCMGSGHILVYAFDILMQIYESAGYTQRDAAKSIIEKNLFGLDIDDRAAQLSYFAVMMKARQYNRRILDGVSDCNVYAIKESNGFDRAALVKMGDNLKPVAEKLIDTYVDAKEYGSILNVDLTLEELGALDKRLDDVDGMSDYGNLLDMMYASILCNELSVLIRQARVMVQKYDAVITNPPYMGFGNMGSKLLSFVKREYPASKSDLSTVCMQKTLDMCKTYGFMTMINIPVWMFVGTYSELRKELLKDNTIINLIHPGRGIFGSDFGTVSFVIRKKHTARYNGVYRKLFYVQGNVDSPENLEKEFLKGNQVFLSCQDRFLEIAGMPIAYWCSDAMYSVFEKAEAMKKYADPRRGTVTGDDARFLRYWQEIDASKFSLDERLKWIAFNKGGDFRKWYGNNYFVANWENDGFEIKNFKDSKGKLRSRPQNTGYFFMQGITWTYITSYKKCFRYYPSGYGFSGVGPGLFPHREEDIKYILGYCNSVVYDELMKVMGATTISLESGEVEKSPIIINDVDKNRVNEIVDNSVEISKKDWDSFETSWDFKKHPLI